MPQSFVFVPAFPTSTFSLKFGTSGLRDYWNPNLTMQDSTLTLKATNWTLIIFLANYEDSYYVINAHIAQLTLFYE